MGLAAGYAVVAVRYLLLRVKLSPKGSLRVVYRRALLARRCGLVDGSTVIPG